MKQEHELKVLGSQTAQAQSEIHELSNNPNRDHMAIRDTDGDGLFDWQEHQMRINAYVQDTDIDTYPDGHEVLNGYDPSGEGRPYMDIVIPRINKIAPIIFPNSNNHDDVLYAMDRGIAFYPGTAIPGQPGNTYLTGHSSDYPWRKDSYDQVFREIYKLERNDRIYTRTTLSNGAVVTHTYVVYDKQVVENSDSKLWYADQDGGVLTLVTSWPLDTTKQRLMVRAELVKR